MNIGHTTVDYLLLLVTLVENVIKPTNHYKRKKYWQTNSAITWEKYCSQIASTVRKLGKYDYTTASCVRRVKEYYSKYLRFLPAVEGDARYASRCKKHWCNEWVSTDWSLGHMLLLSSIHSHYHSTNNYFTCKNESAICNF